MYVQSIMETCGTWHSLVRKLGRCHDVRRTRHVEDKIAESETTDMAIAPGKLQVTRQVYLWLMACMYLFAFSSLYSQIPGELLFPTFLCLYLLPPFPTPWLPASIGVGVLMFVLLSNLRINDSRYI